MEEINDLSVDQLGAFNNEDEYTEEGEADETMSNDNPNNLFIDVNLDETQSKALIDDIEEEMSEIEKEYEDAGYFDLVKASDDMINLAKKENYYEGMASGNGSKRKLSMLNMFADVLTGRAKRQTDTASPVCLFEPEPTEEESEELDLSKLNDMESAFDYRIRRDIGLDAFHENVYSRGYFQGSAIVKNPFIHRTDTFSKKAIYTPEQIAEFEEEYAEELANGDEKIAKKYLKLQAGETVTCIKDIETNKIHAPQPYRVPLDKFYARLSIVDFADQKLLAEQLCLNWIQIDRNFRDGYYNQKVEEDFKAAYPDFEKQTYDNIYEGIWQGALEDDIVRKYQVVFDADNRIILRCIRYPYMHNRPYFINYTSRPRDDRWLGSMAFERIQDIISAMESFLNASINSYSLAHQPIVVTDSKEDLSRTVIDTETGVSVIRLNEKGANFSQIKMDYSPTDRVQFIDWLRNMAETEEGISASLASGGETPDDPRAPAAKTAMKMQMTSMRIEDFILNLQKGDEELFRQCHSMYRQFGTGRYSYYTNGKMVNVEDMKDLENIRYICHGSKLAFNKAADMQVTMAVMGFIKNEMPTMYEDPEVKKIIFETMLNDAQGSMHQHKNRLLKQLDMLIKAKQEYAAQLAQKEQALAQLGVNVDEIARNPQGAIDKMRQQMPGGGMPQ